MTQPFKICPQCQEAAAMNAASCARCGRVYRTTAPPPMQQTQVVQPPPPQYPPSYPPPPFHSYGQCPPQGISVQPGTHLPVIALLLSLIFFVCAGQFYNKQVTKGLALLVASVVLAVFTAGLSMLITYPMAIIDAYLIGQRLNRGEVVGEWQWF